VIVESDYYLIIIACSVLWGELQKTKKNKCALTNVNAKEKRGLTKGKVKMRTLLY